jgi:hypothetical protein
MGIIQSKKNDLILWDEMTEESWIMMRGQEGSPQERSTANEV